MHVGFIIGQCTSSTPSTMEPEGVGDEQQAVPWEVGVGCTWELTQSFSHRDVILFAIDCGASMHESHDGDVPLLIALRAAARLMEVKLVSSPKDHVGVLFWNTVRWKLACLRRQTLT